MRKRDSWLTGEREGVGEEPYLTTARKLGPLLVIQKINTLSQCCGYGMFIPDPGSIELVYFWNVEEKNLGQFSKNYRTFYPKNCHYTSSQKYGFGIRYPRSRIRKNPIPDPGSRGQKGTGSRIRIRNTALRTYGLFQEIG
jgi:hypothetical protein